MKRFIDLRGQIYCDDGLPIEKQEPIFAFFCTITDEFEKFNGNQEWGNKADFIADYQGDQLQRYISLMPNWVPEKAATGKGE